MYELPDNGLLIDIFTYSPFIDSITQPNYLLCKEFLEKIYQDHIYN